MILIAGLGNPGKEYSLTRHNAGFILIDRLLDNLNIKERKRKFKSKIAFADFEGKSVLLMQPLTFMNESGIAILQARKFYKDEINKILIIHDDIDLDFKTIRFKKNGGSAGHKGLISILNLNANVEFDRLRIGVGRPPGIKAAANYVLKNFNKQQQEELDSIMQLAVEAVKDYIIFDIEYCMNKYN
ncbi:MAG: aminoacyl-tRNA hydrolase [Actinobacteria bacterium]|nr:aminoacyl-tRNA hydrolase [Cyanobacteriota bacterium]MCL5771233.1 aminoacyl-tRNA hydrolase [Actinomycetota bacterium]